MTHQVSPITLRKGKTFLWNGNIKENSSVLANVNNLLKRVLKQNRIFIVKSTLKTLFKNYKSILYVLYMPRIKTKPPSDSRGRFAKHILYKKFNWKSKNLISIGKVYVDQRRLKIHKAAQLKKSKINRWLTYRMLRGSMVIKNTNNYFLKQKPYNKYLYWTRSLRCHRFGYKWWFKKIRYNKIINTQETINKVSLIVNKNVNIKLYNIFMFLIQKKKITYKTHQEHLWNKNFRKFRFYYDNYYDIVNSFFILTYIKNSEVLILNILRLVMPRIRKIRKFMYFLDAIIKNMPQIRNKMFCLRINISGKIRGGTERTKNLAIGFGFLPFQSLNIEAINGFISYPHKFGEFGIRLIMGYIYTIK